MAVLAELGQAVPNWSCHLAGTRRDFEGYPTQQSALAREKSLVSLVLMPTSYVAQWELLGLSLSLSHPWSCQLHPHCGALV
jgi:hypothetical protein